MAGYGINPYFLNKMLNTPQYRRTPPGVPAVYWPYNYTYFGLSWANPGFSWPPANTLTPEDGYVPFINDNEINGDLLDPIIHSETAPVARVSRMNRLPMVFGASTEEGWIQTARYWWLGYILDIDEHLTRHLHDKMLFATGKLKEERKLAAGELWEILPGTFKISVTQMVVT